MPEWFLESLLSQVDFKKKIMKFHTSFLMEGNFSH